MQDSLAIKTILDQLDDGADVNISINHVHIKSYGLSDYAIGQLIGAIRAELTRQYLEATK